MTGVTLIRKTWIVLRTKTISRAKNLAMLHANDFIPTFVVTLETIITLGGEEASVANIQRGQTVIVTANVQNEVNTAATVAIQK